MRQTTNSQATYQLLKDDKRVTYYVLKGLSFNDAVYLCVLDDKGYAITSRKYRSANRLDRPDWREHMAKSHAPWDPTGDGMSWVRSLDQHGHSAADFYRRCHGSDEITVPEHLVKYVAKSNTGPREYKE